MTRLLFGAMGFEGCSVFTIHRLAWVLGLLHGYKEPQLKSIEQETMCLGMT
jgi:hypothetical protein